MDQLTLFSAEKEAVMIPVDVISPIESNKSLNSKEFKKLQERWRLYVQAVQDSFSCSWFKAREILLEHRDQQIPISLDVNSIPN